MHNCRMIGCKPPTGFMIPDYVSLFGQLRKYTPEGTKQLQQLFSRSHIYYASTRS